MHARLMAMHGLVFTSSGLGPASRQVAVLQGTRLGQLQELDTWGWQDMQPAT